MNRFTLIAITVSAGSAVAGPALLDFPGPGYREQVDRLSPKMEQKIAPLNIEYGPPKFIRVGPLDPEWTKSFDEPIHLDLAIPIGGAKFNVKESPSLAPKQ